MPQSISLATALEKSKIGGTAAFLVLLDIDVVDPATGTVTTTLHLVRNQDPITYLGNVYQPSVFDITFTAETGSHPQISLTVSEFTGALQGYLEQYGGGVGFNVTMNIVNSAVLLPEVVENFQIISTSAQDYTVSFTLGAENEVMRVFPRRRQTRDFCQWRFKDGLTCRYTGALATCDLTLLGPNGCQAHSNVINFGGFPGINGNGFRYG